jgi:hypothetical protein
MIMAQDIRIRTASHIVGLTGTFTSPYAVARIAMSGSAFVHAANDRGHTGGRHAADQHRIGGHPASRGLARVDRHGHYGADGLLTDDCH